MSADGLASLVARTARAASGPAAFLAAFVAVACALTAAAPAVTAAWATAALRNDVMVAALPSGREITMTWLGGPAGPPLYRFSPAPPATQDSWGRLSDDLDAVRSTMGPALRAATAPAEMVAVSGRGRVGPSPTGAGVQASQVALVAGPSLADEARLVAGSWPGAVGPDGALPVALSAAVARAASWPLGEARTALFADGAPLELVLAGTVEAADPDAAVWDHTSGLLEPSYLPEGQGRVLDAQAIVSPEAWVAVAAVAGQARATAWFAVDGDALHAGTAAELAGQTRAFVGGEPLAVGTLDGTVTPSTRLPLVLDAFAARQALLTRLRAAAVAGPLAAGLATMVLGALLVGRRLDPASRLLAARGASRPQVAALRAGALSVWVVPAALAGVAIGSAAGRGWTGTALLVAMALVAVCAGVVGTPAVGRRTAAAARAVGIAAVATASLASVLVVVRAHGDDPLLLLAPPALALAVGLVVRRGLVGTLRALAPLGRARRGLTAALGPVRAASGGPGGAAALLALVLGVALAVFSGALLTTLRAGVAGAVRHEVGADLRVEPEGGAGPEGVAAVAATAGVRSAVPAASVRGIVARVGASTETLTVVAVDTALLADLWAGSPAAGDLPAVPPEGGDGAVPVIASPWFTAAVGDDEVSIRGHALAPVPTSAETIPLVTGRQWIVVDAEHADDLLGRAPRADLVLVALAQDAQPDAVAAAVRTALGSPSTVVVASDVVAARLAGPDSAGLLATVVGTAVASALLGGLALTASIALRIGERRRLGGLLGALGLRRGEARSLVVWEAAPPAVAGIVAGTVAGIGLAWFVVPALDLAAFTGTGGGVAAVSPGLTAALVGVVASAAAGAVLGAALAARDVDPARALREMTGG